MLVIISHYQGGNPLTYSLCTMNFSSSVKRITSAYIHYENYSDKREARIKISYRRHQDESADNVVIFAE